ncbi:MAG TPA: GspH/FimT family pseudopilin [Rhizomicrobium sp.]|jgi:general secretion pathway protein H|nr:GspH/FimT family pseudopilin [Rhizomicrobium sp.]
MAPTRPCAAGSPPREAGFTLTELLVVLAIIGLLVAAIPVLLQAALPGARALAAARTLANDLRATRGQAIAAGTATAVRFDASRQIYLLEPGDRARNLPNGVHFSLVSGKPPQIGFFADGSSNGGVVFVGDGPLRHRVAIDWLTGRVAVDE